MPAVREAFPEVFRRELLQRLFALESVYLGNLGGYDKDRGANSTREDDHLSWARRQPAHIVADNLVKKYLLQLDRQVRQGRTEVEQFYAGWKRAVKQVLCGAESC